ncbi:MAG: hypothetical protein QGG14_02830, partial [Planctomycetota bacterium]|jgi:hypothetical protein|nr:hypothetical protein [Planctomycetota bacterium]
MIELDWHNGRKLRFNEVTNVAACAIWHTDQDGETWFRLRLSKAARTAQDTAHAWSVAFCASPLMGSGPNAQAALDDLRARMVEGRREIESALRSGV